jgi:hypothetical protein
MPTPGVFQPYPPLGKETTELWDDGVLTRLQERFQWLLQAPRGSGC